MELIVLVTLLGGGWWLYTILTSMKFALNTIEERLVRIERGIGVEPSRSAP